MVDDDTLLRTKSSTAANTLSSPLLPPQTDASYLNRGGNEGPLGVPDPYEASSVRKPYQCCAEITGTELSDAQIASKRAYITQN